MSEPKQEQATVNLYEPPMHVRHHVVHQRTKTGWRVNKTTLTVEGNPAQLAAHNLEHDYQSLFDGALDESRRRNRLDPTEQP